MDAETFERVIYKKNPLQEVVCQIRFPQILEINEKQPVDFQEKIRCDYPLLQIGTEQIQHITIDRINKNITKHPHILEIDWIKNYQFSTEKKDWHINLTSSYLALSTSKYIRWEDFLEHFKNSISALMDIYHPSLFERVGLRYVDAFNRSQLELDGIPWEELIHSSLLGLVQNPYFNKKVMIQSMFSELDIGKGAIAQVNVMKGLTDIFNITIPKKNDEELFIVDSDLFMLNKKIDELYDSLEYLHTYSTKLLRAIITEKLHYAMEPNILC
jgi:uncharacterized protein (TIGR04255 family)